MAQPLFQWNSKIAVLLLFFLPGFAISAEYEDPPVLSAEEIVTGVDVATDWYKINEIVQTDGFMAFYKIASPYGEFLAFGPGMLKARLNEIQALAALQAMQDDERFMEAVESTAKDTATNLRRFVEKPKETLEGVPEGVGRFFNRTERTIKTGVQKLGDVRAGRMPGIDEGQKSNLPGGNPEPDANPSTSMAQGIARAGGNAAIDVLGFDKQRRRLAKTLGIDPYTTNRTLSDELDDVTWAAFAGGLGVNVLTSLLPGGLVISTSSRLSDWVWDTAPGDLRVGIESVLLSMNVAQSDVDRFLRHSFYTLSMQTVLSASLEELDGVIGRANVMPVVLNVRSEGQARFVVQTLDMLRNYHVEIEPLTELRVKDTVIGIARSGRPVVVAPVDYLSWSPALHRFASNFESVSNFQPSMHVDGRVTYRALNELTELGWLVEELSTLSSKAYPIQ